MLREHREIQRWIKRKYGDRFEVLAEIDHQNCLPDRKEGHWYQPDVILRERNGTKDVRYIIEVENDPMRKVIAGACLLADCCLEKMQKAKAELLFIVYSKGGKQRIKSFRNKVEFVRYRLPHLSSIKVVTDREFKQGRGFEIRSTRRKHHVLNEMPPVRNQPQSDEIKPRPQRRKKDGQKMCIG